MHLLSQSIEHCKCMRLAALLVVHRDEKMNSLMVMTIKYMACKGKFELSVVYSVNFYSFEKYETLFKGLVNAEPRETAAIYRGHRQLNHIVPIRRR